MAFQQFEDRMLQCKDCQGQFLFGAGEQEFFAAKGLSNEPKRCPSCRLVARAARSGAPQAAFTEVNCANCSTPTRVPFQPKGYRPVYCMQCFHEKRKHPDEVEETTEATALEN